MTMTKERMTDAFNRAVANIEFSPDGYAENWNQGEYGTQENPSCILSHVLSAAGVSPELDLFYWLDDAVLFLGVPWETLTSVSYFIPHDEGHNREGLNALIRFINSHLGLTIAEV